MQKTSKGQWHRISPHPAHLGKGDRVLLAVGVILSRLSFLNTGVVFDLAHRQPIEVNCVGFDEVSGKW